MDHAQRRGAASIGFPYRADRIKVFHRREIAA
jgi:hypothetical protein